MTDDFDDRRDDPRPAPKGRGTPLDRWRADGIAGLINGVVSVPDGLASAALAGVNPVYGLYTSIAAAVTGSSLVSTRLMQVATTSASALAAGQAVADRTGGERDQAMFLLVVLVGLWLALFGILGFGRLVRYVSHAVMTGFLIGVAVVLVLDQLAPLVGFEPEGANELTQAVDLGLGIGEWQPTTILIGVLALAIAAGLGRTRLATVSSLVALVVPSVLVAVLGLQAVQVVADINPIPRGVPIPAIPDLALLTPDLALAALAVAAVIAIQGAGVSQTTENPDGRPGDPSRDMIAQGAANVASGLLSGIPAGGSVGQTALNLSIGARSRWAGIFGGLWMLAFVALVPGLVGQVPMAVLAALMILAGVSAIDVAEARSIWDTGGAARLLIVVTLLATLLLSVPMAVGVGVVLSVVLFLSSEATDVRVRALIARDDGFVEGQPPERLPSGGIVVLDVYGSLFFAGARTLGERLPRVERAERPVVVLRLRGRTRVGATLIDVLDEYAEEIEQAGGRLYLSGVDDTIDKLLDRTRKLDVGRSVRIMRATEVLGASTREAVEDARRWLREQDREQDREPDAEGEGQGEAPARSSGEAARSE